MLSPVPDQSNKLSRRPKRTSCILEYGLLLMMNAVLRVARAAVLVQRKTHDFPASSTGTCDKYAEECGQ